MKNKKENTTQSRRTFIKKSGIVLAAMPLAQTASSYNRIIGANDRVQVGMVGLHGRGSVLMKIMMEMQGAEVVALCDVDSRVLIERSAKAQEMQNTAPKTYKDVREMLGEKSIDAVVIATPDHTHAPFAIYALKAGKNVYVEKPCCYDPNEGETLVAAQKKFNKVVQVGNQQRSAPTSQEAMAIIHGGGIGDVYEVQTWYTNNRGTIGHGKQTPVPDWLDWDLWQASAPRRPYQDNIVHYNWHWFKHWGTGEINNNALHELDIARWALQAGYPLTAHSIGGRYHFDDDWQFYDTQTATYHFAGDKRVSWVGRSCSNLQPFNRGRGTIVYGSKGSVLLDRNGFMQYDLSGKMVTESKEAAQTDGTDISGEDILTVYHMKNWRNAIQKGEALHSPISDAYKSNLLCHIGNMAQELGRTVEMDDQTGKTKDKKAKKMWKRKYEKGWEIDI